MSLVEPGNLEISAYTGDSVSIYCMFKRALLPENVITVIYFNYFYIFIPVVFWFWKLKPNFSNCKLLLYVQKLKTAPTLPGPYKFPTIRSVHCDACWGVQLTVRRWRLVLPETQTVSIFSAMFLDN